MKLKQPRITIFKHHPSNQHPPLGFTLKAFSSPIMIVGVSLLIACMVLIIATLIIEKSATPNSTLNESSYHSHNKVLEWHPSPSSFPLFRSSIETRPVRPTIAKDPKDNSENPIIDPTAVQAWGKWANPPVLGTFQYSSNSSINFPHCDLQTSYHEHKPNLGNLKGGYPAPVVMNHIRSPDSDLALLTRKGNKYMAGGVRANQDRVVIMSPFERYGDFWLGLFDGHGDMGHVTAHSASLDFPRFLLERLHSNHDKSRTTITEAIKNTYLDVHRTLPHMEGSGSTGISVLKLDHLLYISNVGDSTVFVASYDDRGSNVEIIYTNKAHKPDVPEERKRIEAAGGHVVPAPYPGATARVTIPMPNRPLGFDLALAMSRSLGDFEGVKVGVTPVPTTDVLDLSSIVQQQKQKHQHQQKENQRHRKQHQNQHKEVVLKRHYMVIAASDGLIDKVPAMEVAQHVAKSLLPIHPLSPLPALEQLILKSSGLWLHDPYGGEYRDDISIAVHKLAI